MSSRMFSAVYELECLLCHHSWLICGQTNYHGEGIYHGIYGRGDYERLQVGLDKAQVARSGGRDG